MIYLVCEDEGSGYIFWKAVVREFCGENVVCSTSRGIGSLIRKVEELKLTDKDCLIVAYDNCGGPDIIDISEKLISMHIKQGFKLIRTTYFCFEEMVLSFERLVDFIGRENISSRLIDLIDTMQKCSNISELIDKRAIYKDIIRTDCTLENTYSEVLKLVTSLSKRQITVDKSKIGACWIRDCHRINGYGYICGSCVYSCNSCLNKRDKLIYFEKHSNLNGGIYDFEHWIQFIENG